MPRYNGCWRLPLASQELGFVYHYLVLEFSSTCFNTILLSCEGFWINLWSPILTPVMHMCHTKHTCKTTCFFSSPEHNVLRMSYCDRSLSGVRPAVRPSVCEHLLKKSSPLKPAGRFQWNFTEMILGWCTFRKLQRFEFREELWLPWQPKEKTLKIFLSQTVRARAFIFGMKHYLVALYQNTSNYGPGVQISPMLWVLGFLIEIKKEIFKNLFVPYRKG